MSYSPNGTFQPHASPRFEHTTPASGSLGADRKHEARPHACVMPDRQAGGGFKPTAVHVQPELRFSASARLVRLIPFFCLLVACFRFGSALGAACWPAGSGFILYARLFV